MPRNAKCCKDEVLKGVACGQRYSVHTSLNFPSTQIELQQRVKHYGCLPEQCEFCVQWYTPKCWSMISLMSHSLQ